MTEDGLLSGMFARGPVAAEVSDRAFLQAMLDVEVALARALAGAGIATDRAADEIADAADATAFDLAAIGRAAGDSATPVLAMLGQLRARLSDDGAAHLHQGATSQDVVDTALMLVAKRALAPLLDELAEAADACAELADRHRATLAPGRTLLQQALPVTFGLKAANWLTGLDGARRELADVRRDVLAVQFGGAVGTLAALGDRGLEVGAGLAAELGLADPLLPWHTQRLRPARLSCALGAALGVMGKVGRDVTLLAQTEVAEASEASESRWRGARGLVGDAAQAKSGRSDRGRGLRPAGARAGGDGPRRAWSRSTSAPPAPGSPSGSRCSSCCGSPGRLRSRWPSCSPGCRSTSSGCGRT